MPLEAEGLIVGLLALYFSEMPDADDALARLERFLEQAAPALGRALRSERKTVGMLHAIERLTNLYDLSKAFGSTIDIDELSELIVRKAADFATAEVASLWMLDGEDVNLAATGVNENYDLDVAPEAVGASVVGDVVASQEALRRNRIPESDETATETEGYAIQSVLAVPLIEDELPVGALVLANKRGRHPEFSAEDEELLTDLCRQAVRALRTARQHEAEKKVEELDALLAVSREITADARPRQGDGHDRQRDVHADSVRALRPSGSSRRGGCVSARFRARRRWIARIRTSAAWRSSSSGSSSPARTWPSPRPMTGRSRRSARRRSRSSG